MAENEPSPDRPRPRWPLILGSLVGGFLLLGVGDRALGIEDDGAIASAGREGRSRGHRPSK